MEEINELQSLVVEYRSVSFMLFYYSCRYATSQVMDLPTKHGRNQTNCGLRLWFRKTAQYPLCCFITRAGMQRVKDWAPFFIFIIFERRVICTGEEITI